MIHRVLTREFLLIIKKIKVKLRYTQIKITNKKKKINREFKRLVTINIERRMSQVDIFSIITTKSSFQIFYFLVSLEKKKRVNQEEKLN